MYSFVCLFGLGLIVYFYTLIWDVPLPFLIFLLPCITSQVRLPWCAPDPVPWPPLSVRSYCSPQRQSLRLCQQSLPWHASAWSSPVAHPGALPARRAQKSRSLRLAGLSKYAHCLADCKQALLPHVPGIHRCFFLTISRPCTASFLTPFSARFPCPCSPTFLYVSPRSQRQHQLYVWCSPAVCLAGSPLHGWSMCGCEGKLERALA